MGSVTVEGVGIDASCPDPVAVEENTSIRGNVSYTLVNSSSEDALVDLLVELTDSAGHRETFSQTFLTLPAGGQSALSHSLFLNVNYLEPGEVGVTMRLTVSAAGAVVDTFFVECSLVVREP